MANKPRPVRVPPKRTTGAKSRNRRPQPRPRAVPTAGGRGKWLRRALGVLGALLVATMLFGIYLYVWVVPRDEIVRLVDGYVAVSYRNGRVDYSPVAAMPKDWTPLNSVSDTTAMAFVLAEDAQFYRHHGIDVYEIRNAVTDAVHQGKRPRGAGTISQQVARNLFLSHRYSYWRKVKESAIALQLEHALPKDKILEVYLNVIEYGEGLYGITAASRYYFGKSPARLTPKEAAFLATLLPSPVRYSRDLRREGVTSPARDKMAKILEAMRWLNYLSAAEYNRETAAPLNFTPEALATAAR